MGLMGSRVTKKRSRLSRNQLHLSFRAIQQLRGILYYLGQSE
jgi:hypothetical protein